MIPEGAVDIFGDGLGFIRPIHISGTELDIVNAARVSFGGESNWKVSCTSKRGGILDDKDVGLIRFLLREKHGTPFEHNFFNFHVKAPIFVVREWQRHRIGNSFNEMSGRYTELQPDFYVPHKVREQKGKPGNYHFVDTEDKELEKWFRDSLMTESHKNFKYYLKAIDEGVAKEQARMFLPLNIYTEFRWTTNTRSLMNFLSLRNHSTAQYEIRRYAEEIEKIFAEYFPNVYGAFLEQNRTSP